MSYAIYARPVRNRPILQDSDAGSIRENTVHPIRVTYLLFRICKNQFWNPPSCRWTKAWGVGYTLCVGLCERQDDERIFSFDQICQKLTQIYWVTRIMSQQLNLCKGPLKHFHQFRGQNLFHANRDCARLISIIGHRMSIQVMSFDCKDTS